MEWLLKRGDSSKGVGEGGGGVLEGDRKESVDCIQKMNRLYRKMAIHLNTHFCLDTTLLFN